MPRAWQRHGDLVLLSEDSLRAAPWEQLGKGNRVCRPHPARRALPKAPGMDALLQVRCSGRRWHQRWVRGGWPGKDGYCQAGCGPPVSPCCWARTPGWSTWTMGSGRAGAAVQDVAPAGKGLPSPGPWCLPGTRLM